MASVRRLSAIMFTDMVGSTAAAQSNEAEALQLRDEQAALVRPLFAAHQGREIKSMGDGFLAEFDSALRAVQCAIDIQQHLHERNSQSGVTPIRLRIGIHLGDVEQRESDIFGDAVNIASRIEPRASPGGVSISGEVASQIRNKIPNQLEKLPSTPLKGLESPVDIYHVVLPWDIREPPKENSSPTGIAILPFTNISPDPKDEYFADGLTEELITMLSQLRELQVISRTSAMHYKSTSKPVTQIGAELGVASILEGSVRKAGTRLRVTAQLIDARSDRHTWAQTYDRELDDIFAVQSELAKQVVEALRIELKASDVARLDERPTARPDSYLAYLKGRTLLHQYSEASLLEAKHQFEHAISLDPRNAGAYSGLADATRLTRWYFHGMWHPRADENERRWAARALELDPNLAEAHASLGIILWDDFEYAGAEKQLKLALSLNPSYSHAHHWYAALLEDEGRADEALVELSLAEATDPHWSLSAFALVDLLIWVGRLDEAFVRIQKLGELEPRMFQYHGALAGYYFARSDVQKGLSELLAAEELLPDSRMKSGWHALYYAYAGEKEKSRALLRQEEASPDCPWGEWAFVYVYAILNDLDDCFRVIEKGIERHSLAFQQLRLNPDLENVRRDPRFQSVLRKMNLA